MDNFCIKPDYQARAQAETLVGDITAYWNTARRSAASEYQWDVYAAAGEFLRGAVSNRVADVGCGYPAKIHSLIEPHSKQVTLIDQPSMAPLVARDFPDYRFIPCDLEKPQNLDVGTFDCVICADVIEHLLDPTGLLTLLRSMVSDDGLLFVSTPERDRVRGVGCTTSPNAEHVREWTQSEFGALLDQSGFRIVDHKLLPQKRVAALLRPFLPVLAQISPANYHGCQLAICRAR